MGTRNIIAVYYKGEYRIAQYSQWDGYPEGQGGSVLAFCRKLKKDDFRADFQNKLLAAKWISDYKLNKMWKEAGSKENGLIAWEDARRFGEQYPEFSRDTGSDILTIVKERPEGIELQNNIEFTGDGLFCEWVWLIDLDDDTLEVFHGFNQKSLDPYERFASMSRSKDSPKYTPVKLLCYWPLHSLPQKREMIRACYRFAKKEELNV